MGCAFYRAAGWDEAALEHYKARFGGFGKAVHALPDKATAGLLRAQELTIGGHRWRAVVGRGHLPGTPVPALPGAETADLRDQVLPRITSNV